MTRRALFSNGTRVLIVATGIALAGAARAGEYPIAGVQPHQHPAGAPTVQGVVKGPAWYARALTGLAPPHPSSFRFLEDQGNWSTPFNRPGMPGPYDLRGWHQP